MISEEENKDANISRVKSHQRRKRLCAAGKAHSLLWYKPTNIRSVDKLILPLWISRLFRGRTEL